MNRRQKIIISVTGIFLVLLILVGLTYAYFLTQIQGNDETKSISVTTANLVLRYEDGNGILTPAEKITPDSDVKFLDSEGNVVESKTFNVINDGNQVVEDYAVTLENVKITYANDSVLPDGTPVSAGDVTKFKYPEDFEVTITCTSSKGKRCNGRTTSFPEMNDVMLVNTIEVGETQSYTLTMKYKESGIDQSEDMNKSLTAKINIMDTISTVDLEGTVAYEPGDYVEVNSKTPIRSEITSDGKYKILGVEPDDNHTINVKYKDSEGNVQTRYSYPFSVVIGERAQVYGNEITINKDARTLTMNVTTASIEMPVDGNLKPFNPYNKGTLANKVLENGTTIYWDGLENKIADVNRDGFLNKEDADCINKYYVNSSSEGVGYAGQEFIWDDGNTYLYGDLDYGKTIDTYDSLLLLKYLANPKYNSSINVNVDSYVGEFNTISTTDDNYGTSYYYRGNVEYNYVLLNDLCWRIVRIEGDGSTKIALAGTSTITNPRNPKKTCENLWTSEGLVLTEYDVKNVKYGSNGYSANYESGLHTTLITWYNENFETEEKQQSVKQDTLWCLGGKDNILDSNNYYAAGTRFESIKKPSLLCNNDEESQIYSPIGTLSMDELVFAGSNNNNINYLSEQGATPYWTLSRYGLNNSKDNVFAIYPGEGIKATELETEIGARPVISLKPNTIVTGGNGGSGDPYIIN